MGEFYQGKITIVEKDVYLSEEFLILFISGFECKYSHTYFSHTKTVNYPYHLPLLAGRWVHRGWGGWRTGGGWAL